MYVKLILGLIFLFSVPTNTYAWKVPTQEQLDLYGIAVRLKVDGDIHWFYYKHIIEFDEAGMKVVYGKYLEKIEYFPFSEILNYGEAKNKWSKLKELNL